MQGTLMGLAVSHSECQGPKLDLKKSGLGPDCFIKADIGDGPQDSSRVKKTR